MGEKCNTHIMTLNLSLLDEKTCTNEEFDFSTTHCLLVKQFIHIWYQYIMKFDYCD